MPYWSIQNKIQPFNDTSDYYGKVNINPVSGGMITTQINDYREGTNLRTLTDVFRSNQPKIFLTDGQQGYNAKPNGQIIHESSFQTFGQAIDFIQFFGTITFDDSKKSVEGNRFYKNNINFPSSVEYLIDNGNIVDGLMDAEQVYPIYMNGGPQFMEEAIIEPLAIPYRLATNESPQELARGIFAFYQDGNQGDERRFGAQQVEQMIFRQDSQLFNNNNLGSRPYLEYGANYLIVSASGKTQVVSIKPSAIPDQKFFPKMKPWSDEPPPNYFPSLVGNTLNLINNKIQGTPYCYFGYENTDPELQNRDKKSAAAGYDIYGGYSGLYGTDSIAFNGYYRGT